MKTKQPNWPAYQRNLLHSIIITCFILLIPYIAMHFSDEVNWSGADFAIMGIMLVGTIFLLKQIIQSQYQIQKKYLFGSLVLLIFLLIWIELAVGIF